MGTGPDENYFATLSALRIAHCLSSLGSLRVATTLLTTDKTIVSGKRLRTIINRYLPYPKANPTHRSHSVPSTCRGHEHCPVRVKGNDDDIFFIGDVKRQFVTTDGTGFALTYKGYSNLCIPLDDDRFCSGGERERLADLVPTDTHGDLRLRSTVPPGVAAALLNVTCAVMVTLDGLSTAEIKDQTGSKRSKITDLSELIAISASPSTFLVPVDIERFTDNRGIKFALVRTTETLAC
eukprot:PDM63249.1 hypothetical protein PRIPAC_50464 [Pristionchus pacificus]